MSLKQRTSTANFHRRLINRTFVTNTRNVTIGADAYRQVNTLFHRFDPPSQKFETGWIYNSPAARIETVNVEVANRWHGRTDPPPALPLCGFYGQLCKDANLGQETSKLLAGVITSICLLAIFVGSVIHRYDRFSCNVQKKVRKES
ncbi:hypothetical protein RvY_11491 [Ramazzottius varieornatus]|uniref:Uncharacterized protein n=1 Tax=Ramazzottius varieornatus TaxID=947166 RepID=A0A1D1VKL7_RAMVA|nr:hypothetical protein RvY_11491 [Ramazzottius varieornatus]